jgi:lipopolysaccharide export system permease protein
MQIIDRYVLRQFIKTFAICWLSLTGLYVIVDAFSNLDEFIQQAKQTETPLMIVIGEYYLYRSLVFLDGISAILAMISAMFTLTWLQRHNELTALMAAGVSRIRASRAAVAAAVVMAFLAVVLREGILPACREELANDARSQASGKLQELKQRADLETGVVFRGKYIEPAMKRIHRPTFILPPGLDADGINLAAEDAFYRPREGSRPAGYLFQKVAQPAALLTSPDRKHHNVAVIWTPVDHPDFLKPDELFLVSKLELDQLTPGNSRRRFLSTWELIRGLRNHSLDYGADARVTIHTRIAQPLLDVTLLFLGLPLVLRRETKNIYAAIGVCGALTILFMGVVIMFQSLGTWLMIRPSLAAWAPLLIFVPTAVALYDRIDA